MQEKVEPESAAGAALQVTAATPDTGSFPVPPTVMEDVLILTVDPSFGVWMVRFGGFLSRLTGTDTAVMFPASSNAAPVTN